MKKIVIPIIIIAIIWFVFIFFGQSAIAYGVHPRDFSSLKGILFAPFIHANLQHILSNTIPLFVLTLVLVFFYKKIWFWVWTLSSIMGGALVWLLGRASTNGIPTYHVGASITIFGLLGFLLASGIFRKKFRDLVIAIVIGILYGGALYGVLPTNPHVSWEGHLFGLISGVFLAYSFRKTQVTDKKAEKIENQ